MCRRHTRLRPRQHGHRYHRHRPDQARRRAPHRPEGCGPRASRTRGRCATSNRHCEIGRRANAHLLTAFIRPIRALAGGIGVAVITVRCTLAAAVAATAGNRRGGGRRRCGSGSRSHRSGRRTALVTGIHPVGGVLLFLLVLTIVGIDLGSDQYGLGRLLGGLGIQTVDHGRQFVTPCFAFLT